MNNLIIVTAAFSLDKGETFLKHELEYMKNNFDKIHIVDTAAKNNYQYDENIYVYNVKRINFLKNTLSLIKPSIIIEVLKNIKNINNIKRIIYTANSGIQNRKKIVEIIKDNNLNPSNTLLYSYWFNYCAYAITNVKGNYKRISRAHGFDLYRERGYQAFKKDYYKKLDLLAPISQSGYNELYQQIGEKDKMKVFRLGVNNTTNKIVELNEDLVIISCSAIREVKRVNLIIDILNHVDTSIKIEWIHIGDGTDRDKIEKYAAEKLGSKENIKYTFKGFIDNKEIYNLYYELNPNFIINTSSSEGIPVSMMEAISCGISIIGTNVGGVSEICVDNISGHLLNDNIINDATSFIKDYNNTSYEEKKSLSKSSYQFWTNNYNADENYNSFIKYIRSL